MIAIDESNLQSLDADPKVIHQINFSRNLEEVGNTIIFFILEEVKETIFPRREYCDFILLFNFLYLR